MNTIIATMTSRVTMITTDAMTMAIITVELNIKPEALVVEGILVLLILEVVTDVLIVFVVNTETDEVIEPVVTVSVDDEELAEFVFNGVLGVIRVDTVVIEGITLEETIANNNMHELEMYLVD